MKPNDVIALIIGLHILFLAFLSYGLVRLFLASPTQASTGYPSGDSSGYLSVRDDPLPPVSQPHGAGGIVNLPGVGGVVNIDGSGPGGIINVEERGPGGRINVAGSRLGPGGRVNV
ncbi:hypothetical protein F5Y10DRAFT_240391 [Nemania abortiva]|nr:hypothetical protein F5Y10DRAFT_240391 [Nemania abortiva]